MVNTFQAPDALLKAQKLADLTDSKVRIPFLGIRFGFDFLIGLVPFFGDLIMALVSFRIVKLAKNMSVPNELITLMYRNIAFDFLFGLIPFVGDFIDLFYKSNQKNVRIIETWWVTENHQKIKANSQNIVNEWNRNN